MKCRPTFTEIYEARSILGLNDDDGDGPLTKSRVQNAYVRAALRHHPDIVAGKNRSGVARPCASAFRKCCEAREILLAAQRWDTIVDHGPTRRRRNVYYNHRAGKFPSLRFLTWRQNLALRGIVAVTLTVGCVWDDYSRKSGRETATSR